MLLCILGVAVSLCGACLTIQTGMSVYVCIVQEIFFLYFSLPH